MLHICKFDYDIGYTITIDNDVKYDFQKLKYRKLTQVDDIESSNVSLM